MLSSFLPLLSLFLLLLVLTSPPFLLPFSSVFLSYYLLPLSPVSFFLSLAHDMLFYILLTAEILQELDSTLVRSLPACPCLRSSVLGRIKSVMSEGSLGSLAVHVIEEPALFFFQFLSQYSYIVAI